MNTTQIDMSPKDIRIAMLKAGVTQAEIARELNVTHEAVYLVVEGRTVSDGIRRKIAERIGLDIRRIWPSVYMFNGPRKPGRPVSLTRKLSRHMNSQRYI